MARRRENKIGSVIDSILAWFNRKGFDSNYLLFTLVGVIAITFLSYNIYKTIKRAELNYEVREEERLQHAELLSESNALDKQLEYLESPDAKHNLAVDGYKLAEPGEELYKIERELQMVQYIEEENNDPIRLDNNRDWWLRLLGISDL